MKVSVTNRHIVRLCLKSLRKLNAQTSAQSGSHFLCTSPYLSKYNCTQARCPYWSWIAAALSSGVRLSPWDNGRSFRHLRHGACPLSIASPRDLWRLLPWHNGHREYQLLNLSCHISGMGPGSGLYIHWLLFINHATRQPRLKPRRTRGIDTEVIDTRQDTKNLVQGKSWVPDPIGDSIHQVVRTYWRIPSIIFWNTSQGVPQSFRLTFQLYFNGIIQIQGVPPCWNKDMNWSPKGPFLAISIKSWE